MGGRGSGGHNRKPETLKALEGNRGRRDPTKQPEESPPKPKESTQLPTCPGWLNPEAKREWHRVCSELSKKGILVKVDRSILSGYCSAYARWRKAEEDLNKNGLTQDARHGRVARPEVKIARESLQQMRTLASELGLTPKSRTAVTPHDVPKSKSKEDPLEDLLNWKG